MLMYAGATEFTRMPDGAHSHAACWVSAITPALLAEYAAGPRPPRSPAALVTFTMAPRVPPPFIALRNKCLLVLTRSLLQDSTHTHA